MLSLQYIRENKDSIKTGLIKRNFKNIEIIDEIISLDESRKKNQTELDNKLASANGLSKEIGILFKNGDTSKANILKVQTLEIKLTSKKIQEDLQKNISDLIHLRVQIPNIPLEIVPSGFTEDNNEEIYNSGEIQILDDKVLPHWDLAEKFKLIDFESGSKITGAGFPVYTGKGARLQRALINYFLDKNIAAGYLEVQVPHLVNEESGFATGQLPDKEGQMYHINNENLYLIPTAEVPLTNLYRDKLLSYKDLPVKLTGYTPCFRREAGSYGSHVRGLNRLHQFDKVEIVRIEEPENSLKALDEMIDHVKNILNELNLPYRILRLCAGDLGFTSALTYDFEIYSIAQKRWLEVSSVSTFNDFQSERLKLRYRNKKGEKKSVYTLNGSSLALPRIMAGLIENFQNKNEIIIPKPLVKYTGFDKIS
jgi:seryl-tRNA synthetase